MQYRPTPYKCFQHCSYFHSRRLEESGTTVWLEKPLLELEQERTNKQKTTINAQGDFQNLFGNFLSPPFYKYGNS